MNDQNNDSNLKRWLQRMWQTQDEEISCSEFLDLVSEYVDLELASGESKRLLPALKQHLDQCTVCQEEYLLLLNLARMEAEGNPPLIDDLIANLL
jgi:hypothetical protein